MLQNQGLDLIFREQGGKTWELYLEFCLALGATALYILVCADLLLPLPLPQLLGLFKT